MNKPAKKQSSTKKPTAKASTKKARTANKRAGAFGRVARRMTFTAILVGVALVGGIFVALNAVEVPDPTRTIKTTSFVCLADVRIGECTPSNSVAQFAAGGNKRVIINLDEMSDHLINAVIAAEDRSFFTHGGVDPLGIGRALYRQVAGSASRQGGSTITQQYVKQVYLSSDQTYKRKLNEAAIAIKLERQLTKPEILELYLNEIYLGRGAVGVEAASRAYFDKDAKDLSISESAFLAGLIRAPKYADEPNSPDKPEEEAEAKRRRHTVLVAMREMDAITDEELIFADQTPFEGNVLATPPPGNGTDVRVGFAEVGGDYVIDWVREQLLEMDGVGENALFGDGLRVYLTVNPVLQQAANDAVRTVVTNPTDPSAALVSIDDRGGVTALIGGQDHDVSEVNLALGRAGGGSGRAAGSTFKPIALAEYVDEGNSVESKIWAPAQIIFPKANNGEDWEVDNYENQDLGELTVETATWRSANTAYAQIMNQITPANFALMAARLGITSEVKQVPSSVLGTTDVSVLELATAYSTFANHGTLKPPHIISRVEASDGTVIYDAADDQRYAPRQAIAEGVADTVNMVLNGVVKSGTGVRALLEKQSAGKTGTTQDYRDAWFAGYTCTVSTVVWMGYPGPINPGEATPAMDNVNGEKVTGGSFPADIWRRFMTVATADDSDCSFGSTDYGTTVNEADPEYAPTTTTTVPTSTTTVPEESTETVDEDNSPSASTTTVAPKSSPSESPDGENETPGA